MVGVWYYLIKRINWRFTKKVFMIASSITSIYLLLAMIITMTMLRAADKPTVTTAYLPTVINDPSPNVEINYITTPTPTPENDQSLFKPPIRTSFLMIGLDQNRILTDALMVGCFYRDTQEIKLMSIPRDLYTCIPEHRMAQMKADGLRPPSIMKINSLRAFGGRKNGITYLSDQLGEMLGVHFQYYIEVDIPAFRRIVDAIGGVYIEVPSNLFYEDPYQDLIINIPKGRHLINGAMAEGLVRFRSATGDLGRNAVQMEFMTQLIRQTLKRDALMREPATLLDVILNDVRANFGITDALKYLPYIGDISADKISTYVMPGVGEYVNGISYFIPDIKKLPAVINEVFYASTSRVPSTQVSESISHNQRIQVLNGSLVPGLASSVADILTHDGYNVTNVDIFNGTKENRTRIWVRSNNLGGDLLPYFRNAIIKHHTDLHEDFDIIIIVGRGEG